MTSDPPADSYALAASMATRWLSAYCAQEDQADQMLAALTSEPRGLALAFGALGQIMLDLLEKLNKDGAIEGGVQLWLDRLALDTGAAADEVVTK
jgi:hypothetical protein